MIGMLQELKDNEMYAKISNCVYIYNIMYLCIYVYRYTCIYVDMYICIYVYMWLQKNQWMDGLID